MNVYEMCPTLENDRFLLRLTTEEDCDDLLAVYSDKLALPFFNSDNCHGDNFYYVTRERMAEALGFWKYSYDNGWFVRLSIIDKATYRVIGTVELCLRVSEDAFDHMGILRVDVRSDYEEDTALYDIFSLVTPHMSEMLGCSGVITKAPIYAVDRIQTVKRAGYVKSEHMLVGHDGRFYDGYWVM
ncbi:MAG: GNAT family N-acetyltransferase [Lachnospiraceae bacterium]|nr:GNAT family N-acetyltransferase [Lachnospiraceae bacterium]